MTEPILRTQGLTRTFGALAAVDGVDLTIASGRLHALIGPNGAGKSTLLNLLSGQDQPTGGQVFLQDRDVTALPAHARARLGIGRSFQKTNVFQRFTCLENCRLGAQRIHGHGWRMLRPAERDKDVTAAAEAALDRVGLLGHAHDVAATLSHGARRQLEIAMMLACEPDILLLDEPLAGMGADEAARILALLKDLRGAHTIVLVEHDMDAVFQAADDITVMVQGQVLEQGAPDAIKASKAVREAYLGDEVMP